MKILLPPSADYNTSMHINIYRSNVKDWLWCAGTLLLLDLSAWLCLPICEYYIEAVSRRMANLSFVVWMVTLLFCVLIWPSWVIISANNLHTCAWIKLKDIKCKKCMSLQSYKQILMLVHVLVFSKDIFGKGHSNCIKLSTLPTAISLYCIFAFSVKKNTIISKPTNICRLAIISNCCSVFYLWMFLL